MMLYRRLGKTGLKVSEISLGSWLTYGGGVKADTAVKHHRPGVRAGNQLFRYRQRLQPRRGGESGRQGACEKYDRSSYVLATKVFFPMGDGPNDRGLSRKHVTESADASLKRLGA